MNSNIKCVPVGFLETNCFLVQAPDSKILYVIDPGGDASLIVAAAKSFCYEEAVILLTHAHVDHISGVADTANALGVTKVYLNPDDLRLYQSQDNAIPPYMPQAKGLPNPVWDLNDPDVTVINCPGHTRGGASYYIPKLNAIFSGDTLFYESIGRTDLPGSDHKAIMDTLKNRLLTLPADVVVYPGHGECTTIGHESACNPFI